MEILEEPIVDFYKHSLQAAQDRGFLWVVTMIARHKDVDELYEELQRSWIDLNSLTDKYFLFVFAGKQNTSPQEERQSVLYTSRGGCVVRHPYVRFMNSNESLYTKHFYRKFGAAQDAKDLKTTQTEAVNDLRDYFLLTERDIPCLVFSRLLPCERAGGETQIVPIKNKNLYKTYFKPLFNDIQPKAQLAYGINSRLRVLEQEVSELKTAVSDIENTLSYRLWSLERKLWSYDKDDLRDEKGQSLADCMNNLSYGKFDEPLRGFLNKYIDLSNNYKKEYRVRFNSDDEDCQKNVEIKAQLEERLGAIIKEKERLRQERDEAVYEISCMIEESQMQEKEQKNTSNITINNYGNNAQTNVATDHAVQNISNTTYTQKISELLTKIREEIPADISEEDLETVNAQVEIIAEETKAPIHKTVKIQKAIQVLFDILGNVASIVTLQQFIAQIL